MFKWSTIQELPLDEKPSEWSLGEHYWSDINLSAFDHSDDIEAENYSFENEGEESSPSSLPNSSNELLSSEQEKQLAYALQKAFVDLQHQLLDNIENLQTIHNDFLEKEPSLSPAILDRVLTLHDTLLVYGYLVERDSRFETEYQQVWERLKILYGKLPINRDLLIALAENQKDKHLKPLNKVYELRNHFVSANIRLVYFVARRHMERGMTLDDMVQEGVIGLMRAAFKFDPNVGVRFSTYSFWWIKQAIRQAISKQRSMVRYPTHVNDQVNRVYAVKQKHLAATGKKITLQELQQQLDYAPAHIKDLLSLTNLCVSSSAPIFEDGNNTLEDELTYEQPLSSPISEYLNSERSEQVEELLALLSERQATVVRLRYGIGHRKPYSLSEIAPQMGISRERVRQIAEEALAKIRQHFSD
ncbi:MAG: sigma-70 family RNA polymerase sigma factor [Pseudomonadales bacterium]|nr:sigma-70 family RNA polymerase sigma factor [Pseudomonadales bacterium]